MEKKRYRKAVFVVVYRKEKEKIKYLLLKRKRNWIGWEFCKGGNHGREPNKKTALREVKEETGHKALNIKKYNKSGKYKYSHKIEDRPGMIGQTYNLFSAEIGKGKITMDTEYHEHSAYKWVDYKKALKMLTWSNQRACLRLVNRTIQ